MGIIEATNLIITMSGILVVGIFFGFNHLTRLREYTLSVRKRNRNTDIEFKRLERMASVNLHRSIVVLISTIALGIALVSVDGFNPFEVWYLYNIPIIILYGMFLFGCLFIINFVVHAHYMRNLVK